MKFIRIGLILFLGVSLAACASAKRVDEAKKRLDDEDLKLRSLVVERKPLSELEMSKIGHIAAKGRVQDRDYNQLEVVDQLLVHDYRESIPYLIEKLDDETEVKPPPLDYWQKVTVGDVALVILTDFMTSPSGKVNAGASWEELFGVKKDPNSTAEQYLRTQLATHSRGWLKEQWQKILIDYRGRLFWDDQDRYWVLA